MTIEERKRTCNYCLITFENIDHFTDHWKKCPMRIKNGYITVKEDGKKMSLHDEIMNIPCNAEKLDDGDNQLAYKLGHRDSRHAAAKLALKSDAEIANFRRALDRIANLGQYENSREGYSLNEAFNRVQEIATEALK